MAKTLLFVDAKSRVEYERDKVFIDGKEDFASHARVFPWDSVKFFFHFIGNGIQVAF